MKIVILLCFPLISQALGEDMQDDNSDIVDDREVSKRASFKQLHRNLFNNRRRSRFGVKFERNYVETNSTEQPITVTDASHESTTELLTAESEEPNENITKSSRRFFRNRFRLRSTTEKTKQIDEARFWKISNTISTTRQPQIKFSRKYLFPNLHLVPTTIKNTIDNGKDGESNNKTIITEQITQQPEESETEKSEKMISKENKNILHALFCIRKQTARRHIFFRSRSKSKSSGEKKMDTSKEDRGDNRLSKALKKTIHRARVRDHISKKLKLSKTQFRKFLASALSKSDDTSYTVSSKKSSTESLFPRLPNYPKIKHGRIIKEHDIDVKPDIEEQHDINVKHDVKSHDINDIPNKEKEYVDTMVPLV